jgi:NADPH:quinone reductase-like Zn-dependent oxidoreductase
MKAAILYGHGLENLHIQDFVLPEVGDNEVLVRVTLAGVNPIDSFIARGLRKVQSFPRIIGSEFVGLVEKVGDKVSNVREGDKVIVYPRIFDGSCDLCIQGREMLCRSGGLIGLVSNGGFSEYALVPSKNVFKFADEIGWEVAASVPIAALTAYHALKEAGAGFNRLVVVVGASGNTGMFAVQFAKMMGSKVIAVSRKGWVRDFGADYVTSLEQAYDVVKSESGGRMADIVVDPLGKETFERSIGLLGVGGRIVSFGVLTGEEVKVSLSQLYNRHVSVIGTTGGTRREMMEVIENLGRLKVRAWKKFKLENVREALDEIFSPERDGRIFLEPY